MSKRHAWKLWVGSALVAVVAVAQGDDGHEAQHKAAERFMVDLYTGDPKTVLTTEVSEVVRAQMDAETILGQMRATRGKMLGPPNSRTRVDERAMDANPATQQPGEFYFVRFKARYTPGWAYEDVVLAHDKDGAWRIFSYSFLPAEE
jgi:hypothetical protein